MTRWCVTSDTSACTRRLLTGGARLMAACACLQSCAATKGITSKHPHIHTRTHTKITIDNKPITNLCSCLPRGPTATAQNDQRTRPRSESRWRPHTHIFPSARPLVTPINTQDDRPLDVDDHHRHRHAVVDRPLDRRMQQRTPRSDALYLRTPIASNPPHRITTAVTHTPLTITPSHHHRPAHDVSTERAVAQSVDRDVRPQ